jgi:alanine dehydrogenase
MQVRIVRPHELVDLIPLDEALAAVRQAFIDFGHQPGLNAPRRLIHAPSGVRVSVHQGAAVSYGATGLFTHCEWVRPQETKQRYELKQPPVTVVFSTEDGTLSGILIGEMGCEAFRPGLTGLRTAATSAVGTDLLANPGPISVGLFGSGDQANNHIISLSRLRQIREVRVYSPTAAHRQAFAEALDGRYGFPVQAVDAPQAAVEGVDVVLLCTNASVPVIDGHWLRPGQHLTSIVGSNVGLVEGGFVAKKRREIDDYTVVRADVLVANSRAQAIQDQQGDLYDPVQSGLISWDKVAELGEVLVGRRPGRTAPEQITVFKNNAGQGIADLALAALALRPAEAQGLGILVEAGEAIPSAF